MTFFFIKYEFLPHFFLENSAECMKKYEDGERRYSGNHSKSIEETYHTIINNTAIYNNYTYNTKEFKIHIHFKEFNSDFN
jgi:hypothetical protein